MSKLKLDQKILFDTGRNPARYSLLFAVFLSIFIGFSATAQSSAITGTVYDADGTVVPGANIVQKGTSNGVVADFDGNYAITLEAGSDVLVFSFIGFQTVEKTVGNQTEIDVTLEVDTQSLDEVVVTGYSTTKRKNILGAVASVKEAEIEQTTPVNSFDAIRGRVPGVNIISNGGPGAGAQIQIRGISTFEGGVAPLYVVDGQQLDNIDNLDPSDIASLEVLKDGASAAIYGSKSANGVVIITTKKGRSGKTQLDVNTSTVFSQVNSYVPVASTRERVYYEDVRRGASTSLTGQQRDSLSLLARNSFNLQDLLFKTGVRQQVNVAVSGGSETGNFYWNSGFLNEAGTVLNSGYKRFNTQFKINSALFNALKVGTSFYASYEEQNGVQESFVFQQIVERIPYFPVFEPNGNFTPTIAGRRNPVAQATLNRLDDRKFSARSFNFVEWQIIPQLKFRTTLGLNFRLRKRNEFEPSLIQFAPDRDPTGRERNDLDYDILQENFLTYDQSFGNHNVGAIVGNSMQKWTSEFTGLASNEFLSDDVQTFNAIRENGFRQNLTNTFKDRHSLIGFFGTASYNFKEKYLLEGTIRSDASSRFGSNNQYATFKSGSVGWRISGEDFMESSSDLISNLLVRYSYGENGNERIGNYDALTRYDFGNFYSGINGITPQRQLGNPDLKWENTISSNFGVALGMFKGRLSADFNIYKKTTDDLLAQRDLPVESGFTTIRTNIGTVENKGIEIAVSGSPIKTENFEWYSSFNISTLDNVVKELPNEQGFFDDGIFRIEEGQPVGNMFGFKNLGVFAYDESNAFTDDGTQLTPNFDQGGNFVNYTIDGQDYTGNVNQYTVNGRVLQGGDIIWDDVDGDFQIEQADDRQVIGNGIAEYFGGFFNEFKYKNFSFSFLFDYNFGNDIFRDYDQTRNDLRSSNQTPSPDRINNAWIAQGDVAEYATLNRDRNFANGQGFVNSAYVSKGDFIKLRNIRFGYNIGREVLEQIGFIDNLSLNLSINNLLTWTNYKGYNPELGNRGQPINPGVDGLRYPNQTDIILGLNIGL